MVARIKTSLCMIVRDEAANLPACLATAADLVDEIVVVDTGSKDDTREIAERAGARVFDAPWEDDFAFARNESLRHARGEWIFWLDADERLPDPSRQALRKLFGALGDEKAAYLLHLVTPGPAGVSSRDVVQARVFRNDEAVRWEYRIHEQIGLAVQRAGWELRQTSIAVVHLGYEAPGALPRKLERNLRIIEASLRDAPEDGVLLYHRATTLLDARRTAEAIEAFDACAPHVERTTLADSIPILKTRALILEGRLADAIAEVRRGLAGRPSDTTLRFNEAELLAATGDLAAADARLVALLAADEAHGAFASADRTIAAMRARSLLAEVLLASGRAREAEAAARAVVDARPAFGQAWMTLAEALLAIGDAPALARVRERLGASAAMRPALVALDALEASRRGDHPMALATIASALRDAPGHPLLLRVRAAALHASGVRGDELAGAVQAVLAVTPLCLRTRAIARAA